MRPMQLRQRVRDAQQKYAGAMTRQAELYERAGVYVNMADCTKLFMGALERVYRGSPARPVVHIDVGSGTAHYLGHLSEVYEQEHIPHCLIGVEVNGVLAHDAATRLRAEGRRVEQHIGCEETISRTTTEPFMERSYPVRRRVIDAMDVTSDGQIIILQDDARREMGVLFAVLDKLRSQGVEHVNAISVGLRGVGSDMTLEGTQDLHLSDNALLMREADQLTQQLLQRTYRLAANLLGGSGMLAIFDRFMGGEELKRSYRLRTGEDFPDDPGEQLVTHTAFATRELGFEPHGFKTKLGTVVFPHMERLEDQGMLSFLQSRSSKGSGGSLVDVGKERDLLGIAAAKSNA